MKTYYQVCIYIIHKTLWFRQLCGQSFLGARILDSGENAKIEQFFGNLSTRSRPLPKHPVRHWQPSRCGRPELWKIVAPLCEFKALLLRQSILHNPFGTNDGKKRRKNCDGLQHRISIVYQAVSKYKDSVVYTRIYKRGFAAAGWSAPWLRACPHFVIDYRGST